MKILVASDSFKGTLTSKEIGEIVQNAFSDCKNYSVDYVQISDGGEGLIPSIVSNFNGNVEEVEVIAPLGEDHKVNAKIGFSKNNEIAVIEMAEASGITLVEKSKLNPEVTTTYGLGQLVVYALDKGVKKIIMGIGGSATNDAGTGMLQALGVEFYNEGEKISQYMTGGLLEKVDKIDVSKLDERLKDVEIRIACDVTNPLIGEKGATYIFGPQKGGSKAQLDRLEQSMVKYAKIVERDFGKVITKISGGGAAGGVGAAAYSFFNAELISGIDLVLETINFKEIVANYDMVITGEGKMDSQSVHGKAPHGVLKIATSLGIDVIGVCALKQDEKILENAGFKKVYSIVPNYATSKESIESPQKCLSILLSEFKKEILGGTYGN